MTVYTLKLRHTGTPNIGGGEGAMVGEDVSYTLATSQDQTIFQPTDGCYTPWDVQSRRVFDENGAFPALYAGEGGGHGYVLRGGAMADTMPIQDDATPKGGMPGDPAFTLRARKSGGGSNDMAAVGDGQKYVVRRLTPVECERLQNFPDGYTDIPYKGKEHAPDTQRYKALGNSFCVSVVRWIGERIQAVEDLKGEWADGDSR